MRGMFGAAKPDAQDTAVALPRLWLLESAESPPTLGAYQNTSKVSHISETVQI